jgi:hypothetical protein
MERIYMLLFFMVVNLYGQDNSVKIDSVINIHLQDLRTTIGNDAIIFIDFRYGFSKEIINLRDNDLFLLAGIDAKKLKKNIDYFLIRFVLYDDKGTLRLSGANFKIKKISKKEIDLINLSNGKEYKL